VLRYRVEDIDAAMPKILKVIGADHVRVPPWAPTADFNTGPRDTRVTWDSIPASQLKRLIGQKAIEYGYEPCDIEGYQPVGPLPYNSQAYLLRLQPQFPRYMRKEEGSGPPNADYIRGLAELYRDTCPRGGIGVEVGCWTGESAEIAAQFLDKLYCVDPWLPPDFSENEPLFDERTAAYRNIEKKKMESHVAAECFGGHVDIVYIDGMHDRRNVARDILSWFPHVLMDGWIAGHDYDEMETHTGIVEAVNKILGVPAKTYSDSSWAFRKTQFLVDKVTTAYPNGFVEEEWASEK
jgi:hypothetical protein